MLKKTAEVSEVQCVKSANVPLMRFKFRGISIDLLYARLSLRTIPEEIRLKDNLYLPMLLIEVAWYTCICINLKVLDIYFP